MKTERHQQSNEAKRRRHATTMPMPGAGTRGNDEMMHGHVGEVEPADPDAACAQVPLALCLVAQRPALAGPEVVQPLELDLANDVIFKGATVQGINGRRVFETWYEMQALLKSGRLDLAPLITDRIALADYEHGMELLLSGNASKVLMYPNGKP